MARVFKERGEPVDLLLTSTAKRALDTALVFAKELGISAKDVMRDERLYHATVPGLMKFLSSLPHDAERIMLFGHNPGLTDLVEYLSGEDIGNLPTCGMVRIDLLSDEPDMVSHGMGTLVWMDTPKRHPGQT